MPAIAVEAFEVRTCPAVLADLWVQALSVSNDDPVIGAALSAQMREVHDYVAGLIRRSQAAGGVVGARDPEAEAWIFVSVGLLRTVAGRLGGLLGPGDLDRIRVVPRRVDARPRRRLTELKVQLKAGPRRRPPAAAPGVDPSKRIATLWVTIRRLWLCGPATPPDLLSPYCGAPPAS